MTRKQRLLGLLIDLALMGAFGNVWLAAGHGAGPVGLLMFLGEGEWHFPMAVGWSGVAALLALPLVPSRRCYALVAVTGLSALAASLALFILHSERPAVSTFLAAPFVVAGAVRVVYLFQQTSRRGAA